MDEILEKIKALYADELGGDAEVIDMNTKLDDLELDSLDRLDLTVKIEDAYDVDIVDADAKNFTTMRQLVAYVHEHANPTD